MNKNISNNDYTNKLSTSCMLLRIKKKVCSRLNVVPLWIPPHH